MSGGWTNANKPERSGFYNAITAAAEAVVSGGSGGIAALAGVLDWGPVGTTVAVTNQREFEEAFGPSATVEKFAAVGAFTGTGESGSGVTELLVHRPAITGQAKAAITLEHTGTVDALTLTARYHGTLGNLITVTKQDYLPDANYDQLLVFLNGAQVEDYTYLNTDIAGLAAEINDDSDYLVAEVLVGTTALTNVSSQALTGGANGTVTASHYSSALAALETERLNIVYLPSMTDATTLAALRQWVRDQNAGRRRVIGVTGGAGNESMAAAISRSALSDDTGDIVNLGYAAFTDSDGNARSTADMVGYVVGMIASAGSRRSITFDRLPDGFTLTRGAGDSDIVAAINGGVVTFSKDAAGIRVEKGVTTYTDDSDEALLDVLSKIKFVRTIHQIENDLTETTETEWIGKVPNEPGSRASYLGMVGTYLGRLTGEKVIKPGWMVGFDETQDNDGDTLYLRYKIEFTSAIEKVLALGEVSV